MLYVAGHAGILTELQYGQKMKGQFPHVEAYACCPGMTLIPRGLLTVFVFFTLYFSLFLKKMCATQTCKRQGTPVKLLHVHLVSCLERD